MDVKNFLGDRENKFHDSKTKLYTTGRDLDPLVRNLGLIKLGVRQKEEESLIDPSIFLIRLFLRLYYLYTDFRGRSSLFCSLTSESTTRTND